MPSLKPPRMGQDCERMCVNVRMTDGYYTSVLCGFGQKKSPQENNTASRNTAGASQDEEPAVLLDLSAFKKSEKTDETNLKFAADKTESGSGNLDDASGRLTRRLVAAKTREEVHSILSEAYKNLGDALSAAAGGDDEALEIVRRLNKLIRRANRKVGDLTKEDDIRRREKSAKKKELEQLAEQLKQELKRKIAERKRREKKYLKDADKKDGATKPAVEKISTSALDARIHILTHQMALSAISTLTTAITPGEVSISAPAESDES